VAQRERVYIKKRQMEGIVIAVAEGSILFFYFKEKLYLF